MISEALQTVSEGLFRRLFRFVFRYDIFISYARGDGAKYAAALKDQLTKLDFSCFLDVEELPAGNALTRSLRRALKGSATLVIVVTERAAASRYCALEVENFAATERAIVPIDFGGTVAKAPWPWVKERELVWIDELPDALARNVPSPIVADSIDKLFKYTRRNVRVRGQWIGVLVLFLIGATVATFVIRQQVNEARAAAAEAERQKTEAVKQTTIASEATRTAVAEQERANKAAEEAKKQEEIALQNAARAKQEQRRAEAQTRLALSNSMAIDARTQLARRPISALLLAAEAAQVVTRSGGARAPAAEDALRQALANAGGIPLTGHTGTVRSIALSPDQRWLFTSASDGIGRVWSMQEPKLDAPVHVLKAHKGPIRAATFSPDSRWLATGGEDGAIRIWDLKVATVSREFALSGRAIRVVTWSDDSRLIGAIGEFQRNYVAHLWDLAKPDSQGVSLVPKGPRYFAAENIVFSPDGRWVVAVPGSSDAVIWSLTAGTPAADSVTLKCEGAAVSQQFSKDGHWLALGDTKGTVCLFDLTAPDILAGVRQLSGMKGYAFRVAFSPDSRWLAAGGGERTARLWDLSKPNPEHSPILLPHAGPDGFTDSILYLAFDSISRTLLTAGSFNAGEGAHIWRLDAADVPASRVSLQGVGPYATAVAFVSWDKVAVATMDGLSVWNTRGGLDKDLPARFIGHDHSVRRIVTLGNAEWLLTEADDSTPRLWNLRDPRSDAFPQRLSDENRHNSKVVLSADGRWLASEYQERSAVIVFNSERADARFARVGTSEGPFLAMSPDSRWLATSVSREFSDHTMNAVSLLDLRPAGKQMKGPELIDVHEQPTDPARRGRATQRVTAAAFSPNGKKIAMGRVDGVVRLLSLPVAAGDKGRDLRGHKGEITAIVFSRDGHWLVTGGADTKAILWDMTARDPAATPKALSGHDATVHIILFSPDGHWLFTGSRTQGDLAESKRSAFLWDLHKPGVPGIVLPGHERYVTAADISSDGRWLATGGGGPYLRLWNLTRVNPAARPVKVEANRGLVAHLNFSSNGRMLLSRSEDDAMLWDMRTAGNAMRPFIIGRGLGDIEWAGFSPDSTMLITGGYREGTLYAWDVTAPDPTVAPVPLRGDAAGFFAGAISTNSRVLVGTTNEGTKAWPLRPADLVAAACRIAGRNLTVPEWGLLVPGQPYRKTCADYPATEK